MQLRDFTETNIEYPTALTSNLAMNSSPRGLKQDWLARLQEVQEGAEQEEKELTYLSSWGVEKDRKRTGSDYTPVDVATYFWNEFFFLNDLDSPNDTLQFFRARKFVEPSVGAGTLFFALLEKFARMGIPPHVLAGIEVELIDINERALRFVSDQIESLSRAWAIKFSNIKLTCSDFLDSNIESASKPIVFFGNPPFVLNQRGFSQWKNLFADFLKFALNAAGSRGAVQFILPISIAFSRDYRTLRRDLRDTQCKISLSHFDNIPDTLFKAGKPRHINTNKANSQRCSILTVIPSNSLRIHSTELQRWSKKEREAVLSRSPRYFDVTDYAFDDQTPRPKNEWILGYLGQSANPKCFQDWCDLNGKFSLSVAAVARNYIGIREIAAPGVHEIRFETKADFYRALLLLSSDLFFDYWLTIGDGFHVTKANIQGFPVDKDLLQKLTRKVAAARSMWNQRFRYAKTKLNSGKEMQSFDFSDAVTSLYPSASNH